MKKILLFGYIIIAISACSKNDKITKQEEVFTDKGTSVFADNNPYNDVMMQAFWWDSYSDSKTNNYNSFYDFFEDKIVGLSKHILMPFGFHHQVRVKEWDITDVSYLILIQNMEQRRR